MLEFWVDPASPYYRADLDSGKRLVLYCGSAWRSALAAQALHAMGFDDVTHVDGGFSAWKKAGLPITELLARARPVGRFGRRGGPNRVSVGHADQRRHQHQGQLSDHRQV